MPDHSQHEEGQGGTFFLGRYRVVDEIGVGGMASVYLARMDGPGGFQRWVAIKRIHPHLIEDESFVNMFLDEARVAASISHPNVATVFDLGKTGESYWIAMEYLHGEPLREIMRRMDELGQPMPPEIATKIVSDAAEGLHAAHELTGKAGEKLNLVHRDVTPHNLFVTYEGSVKVVDFGIAKFSSRLAHTRAGTLKGKLAYMSPEQVHGENIDRRTDVFALGVVLWELTTGQRLFRMENDLETMAKVQECNVPRPSTLVRGYPLDLEKIVLKALSKNPADRFKTSYEFARALQALLVRRGHFVGSEDVKNYVRSIFSERIETREAHLRWASEVTQTLSVENAEPLKVPRDLPPESMRFDTSGESRLARPIAGAAPIVRPAAGMPARIAPSTTSLDVKTGELSVSSGESITYDDPTGRTPGGYPNSAYDEEGLNETLIERPKVDERALVQLPPVPFPRLGRDPNAPPDLSDQDETDALPTQVMREGAPIDASMMTIQSPMLPQWPGANAAAPVAAAAQRGPTPEAAPPAPQSRLPQVLQSIPHLWTVALASALGALVVVVLAVVILSSRKPDGPVKGAETRGAFKSARDAYLEAQRLASIVRPNAQLPQAPQPLPPQQIPVQQPSTQQAPTQQPVVPPVQQPTPTQPTAAQPQVVAKDPVAKTPTPPSHPYVAPTPPTPKAPTTPPAAKGGGFINVVPACDKVLVNGKAVGSSPLMKTPVPGGEINVKCVLASGAVKAKTIYVDAGETKSISAF